MPKHKACLTGFLALIAGLGFGCSAAYAAGPQPVWSSLVAVAEDSPNVLPDVQWQRIASGEGVAIQRGSQIIVAPRGQAYWVGFSLSAAHLPASSYWLSLQSPTLDWAQLWWRSANGPWTAQTQLQHSQPMSFGSGQLFAVWQLDIPAQQAHLLEGLQLASSYVDDFMHSLRHLAQDQTKPIDQSQFQSLPLRVLLEDTLNEFETLAAMRGVQLRTRLSQSCVWVHRLSLQRLVRNLLSNALRYGASGGKVLLGTHRQGEHLWLWCIDRGKGMSQAQVDACFKAFNANSDSAPVSQSLGLGLFSVKQLALQMQTPLLVRSQVGKGVAIGIGLAMTPPRH